MIGLWEFLTRYRGFMLRTCCSMALAAGMLCESVPGMADDPKRPNFVFIFADDQAYNTIGALGHLNVETPNLDRLIGQGTTFTHAYNQGGWHGAVCVASRNMLNTGRFLWHAERHASRLEAERRAGNFWSEYLKQAGYDTFFCGKWHLQADVHQAFDQVGHVRPGMPKDQPAGYHRPVQGRPDRWKPWETAAGGYWSGGKHWSEVTADDACDYLSDPARQKRPFFMYIAFNAPHDPRQSPREYVERYPLSKISLPKNYLPEYPYKDAIGCGRSLRDERLAPFPRTPYAIQVNRQEYFAIITHLDAQIGRILDALQQAGEAENTYVIFSADHGLAVGHHGLLGKQNMFDHSVRVPFIIRGPEVAANRKNTKPIYLQDVMPTTLELAGIKKPSHVQFRSIWPLLKGKRENHYEAIYGAYMQSQRMVVVDGYKLILYPNIKKTLLFDLHSDPNEMRDLSERKEQAERVKQLFSRLLDLQKQTGDPLDLKSLYPNLT